MKTLLTIIFCLIATVASASTVILQWDANTETDLAGYKVYYSNTNVQPFVGTGAVEGASGITIAKGTTTATLSGLNPAKAYYFAVTAYNTSGMESVYSNIVVVPAFPKSPSNLRFIAVSP
jgi:chitinase